MKRDRDGKPIAVQKPNAAHPQPNLPIRQKSDEILSALAANDVLLVIGETGSGKTTQLPQLIVNADSSASVVVTQPRRVAAITVATRVAAERSVQLGREVGYAVRFQDNSKRGITTIRYVTDGVLLREALSVGAAGLKNRYSHVVIDEVHERSVNTDLILGVIKQTLASASTDISTPTGFAAKNELFAKMIRSRLPFKVVIMSATTDSDKIMEFFRKDTSLKVSMLRIPGRSYPVKVFSLFTPVSDLFDSVVSATMMIHCNRPMDGDILVFLPGQEEIMSAIAILKEKMKRSKGLKELRIFPLYAALSPDEQMHALQPLPDTLRSAVRKVIFATNIAETSLTIPGIVYVVDSGLAKVRSVIHDKGVFVDALRTCPITAAEAQQRHGRAGRTECGTLYRLYTIEEYSKMVKFPLPEILRADAAATMLNIIVLCEKATKNKIAVSSSCSPKSSMTGNNQRKEFQSFPLMDDIPLKIKVSALETLCILGALNLNMDLQQVGRLMARIPVSPMLSRSLLESLRVGCVDVMISLAAVLSVEGTILVSPASKRDKAKNAHKRFISEFGDHLTLVNALNAYTQVSASKRREFCQELFLNFRTLQSAESIRLQLDKLMQHSEMVSWGLSNPLPTEVAGQMAEEGVDSLVRRCLVAGFFRNAARKRDKDERYVPFGFGNGSQLMERGVEIHPSSSLRALRKKGSPAFVIYNELILTTRAYLRTVVGIEQEWLYQHCGHHFKRNSER